MTRRTQVSGVSVLIVSSLSALAVIKMIPYHGDMPVLHYVSVAVVALIVAFSFLGGNALIAGKTK
ncbi:MAG TPA: hypothetical protein VH437_10370 [Terriglobales bacterium]|jgi:hypothetical protein